MVSKFSQVQVIWGQFVPREPNLVRVIGSFEKSRVRKIERGCSKFNNNKIGSRYREVRETEGLRNRDSTVFMSLNLLFRLPTRNGAIINNNLQTLFLTIFLQFLSSPSKESRIASVFITVGA